VNKGELIESIATSCELSKAQAERALNSMISAIEGELKRGNDVQIVGFGTFKVSSRAARTAKNPQTGATVKVAARKVPKFSPGKGLKDLVNGAKKGAAAKGAAKAAPAKGAAKGAAKAAPAKGAAKAAPAKAAPAKGAAKGATKTASKGKK
jgi:DNA-binding protein HU-beta